MPGRYDTHPEMQPLIDARAKQAPATTIEEMLLAYTRLFDLGIARSVETWLNGKLVGGLYGLSIGRVFFGESMFSFESDASKVALTTFVDTLIAENVEIIDCQVYSRHLESLGAETVSRDKFEALLSKLIQPSERIIARSPHIWDN